MKIQKHIDNALKEIKMVEEWMAEDYDNELKFWLKHMYQQGYIAGLQWSLDNKLKNEK